MHQLALYDDANINGSPWEGRDQMRSSCSWDELMNEGDGDAAVSSDRGSGGGGSNVKGAPSVHDFNVAAHDENTIIQWHEQRG